MPNIVPSDTDKQFLLNRGVKLYDIAVVGRDDDGNFLVLNFVPMNSEERQSVIDAGFAIVREWVITAGGVVSANQYYLLRDVKPTDVDGAAE